MVKKMLAIKWSCLLLVVVSACAMVGGILALVTAFPEGKGDEGTGKTVINARNVDAPLRILPLGNSITQSDKNHHSYRYNLWIKLTDAEIKFDFVGSLNFNHHGNPSWPDHKGQSFDPDHEGHWGWTVDDILRGIPGKEDEKLSKWLKEYTPDIVLIHLGSNDIRRGQSTSSTARELRQIIGMLRADNPGVAILLAKLIPTFYDGINSGINELNTQIDVIAAETSTTVSPVIVVDQNSGFDVSDDMFDFIHPNESGEEKLAAKWFYALQTFLVVRTSTSGQP